jgi:hypothetical protein
LLQSTRFALKEVNLYCPSTPAIQTGLELARNLLQELEAALRRGELDRRGCFR